MYIDKIKLLNKISFNKIEDNSDPMQVYLYMRQQIIEAEKEKVIKPDCSTCVKKNSDSAELEKLCPYYSAIKYIEK